MKYANYLKLEEILNNYIDDMESTKEVIKEIEENFIILPKNFEIKNKFEAKMMPMSNNENNCNF